MSPPILWRIPGQSTISLPAIQRKNVWTYEDINAAIKLSIFCLNLILNSRKAPELDSHDLLPSR